MNGNAPIKMKQQITFERLLPNTINGHRIAITQVISSHNKQEIDDLEQTLSRTIGTGIMSEYEVKEQE